jgi:hypothetical protein
MMQEVGVHTSFGDSFECQTTYAQCPSLVNLVCALGRCPLFARLRSSIPRQRGKESHSRYVDTVHERLSPESRGFCQSIVQDAVEGVAVSVVLHAFEPAVVEMYTCSCRRDPCCCDIKHALLYLPGVTLPSRPGRAMAVQHQHCCTLQMHPCVDPSKV